MADDADRAQEMMERSPPHRASPTPPRYCLRCGSYNDRRDEGYGICWDCTESLQEKDHDSDG